MAREASEISIAAPFWGAESIKLLDLPRSKNPKPFRALCNLESGACNPAPIRTLRDKMQWDVRTNPRLHAKVYLFSDIAIIGSANPSANGLALEDRQVTGWFELCTEVTQTDELDQIRGWFGKHFFGTDTKKITVPLLKSAERMWKASRSFRSKVGKGDGVSLKVLANSDERELYLSNEHVWIYNDLEVSAETKVYDRKLEKDGYETDGSYEVKEDPSTIPYDVVIDCHYSRHGKKLITNPELFRLFPQLAKKLRNGWWALPCRAIAPNSLDGQYLDAETKSWIHSLVQKHAPQGNADWDLTLGLLVNGNFNHAKKRIRSP